MTYFAWRAAPLGPVPAAPVVAMFAGFHPGTVARALPDAWSRTTPQACLEARAAVSAAALREAGADPEACGRAAAVLDRSPPPRIDRPAPGRGQCRPGTAR